MDLLVASFQEQSDLTGRNCVRPSVCPSIGWLSTQLQKINKFKKIQFSKFLWTSKILKPKCVSGHSKQLWFLKPPPTPKSSLVLYRFDLIHFHTIFISLSPSSSPYCFILFSFFNSLYPYCFILFSFFNSLYPYCFILFSFFNSIYPNCFILFSFFKSLYPNCFILFSFFNSLYPNCVTLSSGYLKQSYG